MDSLPAYHLTHFAAGQPASGGVILRHVFSRAARLPAGATLSRAVAGVAATGPSAFALLKNGTPIGEVQFAAGEAAGSFSVAAAVDFAAGDIFAIAAPDPQDAPRLPTSRSPSSSASSERRRDLGAPTL